MRIYYSITVPVTQVVAHPACGKEQLAGMQPQVLALVALFVHCRREGRKRRITPEVEQVRLFSLRVFLCGVASLAEAM